LAPEPKLAIDPARNPARPDPDKKLLVVCAVDIMPWVLLRNWLFMLRDRGFEVHIACSRGEYFERLEREFRMHPIHVQRNYNLLAHINAVAELVRLIRAEDFQVINTHSPIGAAVGRVAAWIGGVDTIIYTVHGFYFHDDMSRAQSVLFRATEWFLGRITDGFMFVSDEDRKTAEQTGIASVNAAVTTIYNGVDLGRFEPRAPDDPAITELRKRHHLPQRVVIGAVGRIVREKGYREFLEMATQLTAEGLDATYLVVGDSLPSDRDHFGPVLRRMVADAGLSDRFVFTGMTDRVADYLALMDIFVLPSYREGFPRSVLEAMAMGLPVIASDIRGCREAVARDETGLLVPARDAKALAAAVRRLASNEEERRRMGSHGRARARNHFDGRVTARRFADFVEEGFGRAN
jgi:glycosyltransferase involved in cell wall biosynthesis